MTTQATSQAAPAHAGPAARPNWRIALSLVAVPQLIYLVLFSFTFFWKGFTGLAITVGAIVTLFVIMQVTGRLDWQRAGRAGG